MATARAPEDAETSVSCSLITTVQSSVHITLVLVFTSATLPLLALGIGADLRLPCAFHLRSCRWFIPRFMTEITRGHVRVEVTHFRCGARRGHKVSISTIEIELTAPKLYKFLQIPVEFAQILVKFNLSFERLMRIYPCLPLFSFRKASFNIRFPRPLTSKELRFLGLRREPRATETIEQFSSPFQRRNGQLLSRIPRDSLSHFRMKREQLRVDFSGWIRSHHKHSLNGRDVSPAHSACSCTSPERLENCTWALWASICTRALRPL